MTFFGKKKPIVGIVKDDKVIRHFNYSLVSKSGTNIELSFSLRTDIKDDLRAFQELMDEAQRDVEEEINK